MTGNEKEGKKPKKVRQTNIKLEEEVNPDDVQNLKRPGTLGKLYLKGMGSIGLVENTRLEPTFADSILFHEEYRCLMDSTFQAVEQILQPNIQILSFGKLNEDAATLPDGSKPYYHPMDRISRQLVNMQKFLEPPSGKPDYLGPSLPIKLEEWAEFEKQSRTNCRSQMNRTRLFLTREAKEFKEHRAAIDRDLLLMDDLRNQLKKAKTRGELEGIGKGYHATVLDFNRRTEQVDRVVESYAETAYFHMRDTNRFFCERDKFHNQLAKKIQEWDNTIHELEEKDPPKKN